MDVLKDRYSITELSEYLNITDHALRFYEKEFGIKVPKDSRGRRYYTTDLANLMYKIKDMRDQGLELKAIRKILEDENIIPRINALSGYTSESVKGEQLPVLMGSSPSHLNSSELAVIMDAINDMKEQVFNNISTEFMSTKDHISKEIQKSKLELGACVENSSRKLEIKLDRHFQEVDRSITSWRERRNTSLAGRLRKLIGK